MSHHLNIFPASCLLCHSALKKNVFYSTTPCKIAFILPPFYLLGLLLCHTTCIIFTFILPHEYLKRILFCRSIGHSGFYCATQLWCWLLFYSTKAKNIFYFTTLCDFLFLKIPLVKSIFNFYFTSLMSIKTFI